MPPSSLCIWVAPLGLWAGVLHLIMWTSPPQEFSPFGTSIEGPNTCEAYILMMPKWWRRQVYLSVLMLATSCWGGAWPSCNTIVLLLKDSWTCREKLPTYKSKFRNCCRRSQAWSSWRGELNCSNMLMSTKIRPSLPKSFKFSTSRVVQAAQDRANMCFRVPKVLWRRSKVACTARRKKWSISRKGGGVRVEGVLVEGARRGVPLQTGGVEGGEGGDPKGLCWQLWGGLCESHEAGPPIRPRLGTNQL